MQQRTFGDLAAHFGFLALLSSAQFLACFGGSVLASGVALLLGSIAVLVALRAKVLPSKWWPLPLACLLASLVGVSVALLLPQVSLTILFAPVCAALGCILATLLQQRSSRRCSLCNHRIGSGEVTFGCPRCGLTVCDRTCWDFDNRRCRLCSQNHVPLLPQGDQWWDRVFGPPANYGRCRVCFAAFDERDLRPCGKCGRSQCREDWDSANGECVRCGWVCPELPESLRLIPVSIAGESVEL